MSREGLERDIGLVHGVAALVTNDRQWTVLEWSADLPLTVCELETYLPFQ